MIKDWIRRYFSFNQREVNGVMILVPLLFIILITPFLIKKHLSNAIIPTSNQTKEDSLISMVKQAVRLKASNKPAERKKFHSLKLFPFDPNTIDSRSMAKMGLNDRLISTIVKYRSKGGSFKVKKDLAKIYGLSTELYTQLHPYITLPDTLIKHYQPPGKTREKHFAEKVIVDLNLADTSQLKKVYGVGSVLSKRIISYRNSLGGFHSMDQLSEVYGLTDTVVQKIKKRFMIGDSTLVSKMDVLNCSEEKMRKHPYITFKLAKVIVAYRKQHRIDSINQLREIKIMTDSVFKKIKPYVGLKPTTSVGSN